MSEVVWRPMSMVGIWEPPPHDYDEPRRKTCRVFKSNCGTCANCQRDRWSQIWRALQPEDREWVVAMYAAVGIPEYRTRPNPGRYVWM